MSISHIAVSGYGTPVRVPYMGQMKLFNHLLNLKSFHC